MDVRSRAFTADLAAVINDLDARGYPPRRAVPRRHRRRADPPLRAKCAQPPAAGRRSARRRHRRRARPAAPAARRRRPRRRHLRPVGATSCAATLERTFGADYRAPHARSRVRVVRLQVRPPDGLRPRRRRAVPAEPVLDPRAARADRSRRAGRATTCSRQEGAKEFLDRYLELLDLVGARVPPRGQALPDRRRSAAPAASTAASPSPRRSPGGSSGNRGLTVSVAHRDLGRE